MTPPSWVEQGLAVAMVATALYCAARLVLPRWRDAGGHQDSDIVHVAMATVMAAMLLGVGEPVWGGAAVLAFLVPAAWFGWRARAALRPAVAAGASGDAALGHVQLCIASIAMVYMSGAIPGFGSMADSVAGGPASEASTAGHMGHQTPVAFAGAHVDWALAGTALMVILAAFAVSNLGQLSASAVSGHTVSQNRLWPRRLTLCCQIAMGATMAHMIAAML